MRTESIQMEYLELLQKVVDLLKKTDNSLERQRSLYHLRSLSTINLSAGDCGDGPTATSLEVSRKRIDIFQSLSNLGTESLFDSER